MFKTVLCGHLYVLKDETGRIIHTFPAVSVPLTVQPPSAELPTAEPLIDAPPGIPKATPKLATTPRKMITNAILRRVLPAPGTLLAMPSCNITGTPALNKFGLPAAKRQREVGAGRTFKIRRTPMATAVVTTRCLELITPNGVSDANIAQDFEAFAVLNGCDADEDRDLFCLIFVIDMTLQGIKPSSAKTYLSAILRMARRVDNPIRGPHINDAYKILDLLSSEEEASHARDITLQEAIEIVSRLSGIVQATVFFMIICGARVKDLTRLKRHQILIRIFLDFGNTKIVEKILFAPSARSHLM